MKKVFLAAALALATTAVSAQEKSNVTISGRIAAYYQNIKEGTAGRDNNQTTDISWITIRADEDLGNGLKARAVIRTRLFVDDPQVRPFGGDQLTVGLSNQLGSLDLGRNYHALGTASVKYSVIWDDFGSHYDDIHSAQGRRLSNGVFASVNVTPNLSVQYDRGDNIISGSTGVDVYSAHAKFAGAQASLIRYNDSANRNVTNALGVLYNIEQTGTTLVGFYTDDEQAGVKTTGTSVGVRQKIAGPWSATAGYGTTDSAKSYVSGLTYTFSKRTQVHARFTKLAHDNAAQDREQLGLGIEHWF